MLKFMTSKPSISDAEATLAQRQSALNRAQSKLDDAKRTLHNAHNANDAKAIKQADADTTNAETKLRRAQDAVDAAEEQLREAQNAERENAEFQRKQRLTDTLNARTTLAKRLHDNAKARADMIREWLTLDETLAELQTAGVVSQNAMQGHTFGVGRLLTLLGFEDRAATLDLEGHHRAFPYTGQQVVDRTKIPNLCEIIAADHRTIKGE